VILGCVLKLQSTYGKPTAYCTAASATIIQTVIDFEMWSTCEWRQWLLWRWEVQWRREPVQGRSIYWLHV